jgi:hypothetical protein
MISIPARWSAAALCSLLLVMFGASSCNKNPSVTPSIYPPTTKKNRPVPCDTTINADPNTGGVDLDAAFVCEKDTVTWKVPAGHHFHIEFTAGSPFKHGKSKFDDVDNSGDVKDKYDKLEVYKYSITVDTLQTKDPQVVGGGNP